MYTYERRAILYRLLAEVTWVARGIFLNQIEEEKNGWGETKAQAVATL